MQESKQEYSLFWNDGWQPNDEGDLSGDLHQFIEECAAEFGLPIAWAPGYPASCGVGYEQLRAESIAAGRLIEEVDGKWVARGLETQEQERHDSDCSLHNAPALPVGPCDCSSHNAAMIARDGPAKPAPAVIAAAPVSTTKPPIAGLTRVSAQDHRVGGWGFVR